MQLLKRSLLVYISMYVILVRKAKCQKYVYNMISFIKQNHKNSYIYVCKFGYEFYNYEERCERLYTELSTLITRKNEWGKSTK